MQSETLWFTLTPTFTEAVAQNGRAHISCEMMLSLRASREECFTVPEGAVVSSRPVRDTDSIFIYYPTDKDSLWSVGKAYGIPSAKLARQNDISTDADTAPDDVKSLDGVAWLFASEIV